MMMQLCVGKVKKCKNGRTKLIYSADQFNFPIHRPYFELSEEEKLLLWTGTKHFKGLNAFFQVSRSKTIQNSISSNVISLPQEKQYALIVEVLA